MITKEQAIEILKGDFSKVVLSENESHSELFTEAFNMAVEALNGKDTNVPSNWIPVSEGLPPIDMSYPNAKDYLVYYEHGYYDVVSYNNINRFWHGHTTEQPYWNCSQYCKVVAWMPLPPAFKGE